MRKRWQRTTVTANDGKRMIVWANGAYHIARSVCVATKPSRAKGPTGLPRSASEVWYFEVWLVDARGVEEWIPRKSTDLAANDPDNAFAGLDEAKLAAILHEARASGACVMTGCQKPAAPSVSPDGYCASCAAEIAADMIDDDFAQLAAQ